MADIGIFASIITQLNHLGFYGFILPWLLMFALTFGLLKRAEIFGKEGGKIAAVVALALAFFITATTGIGDYFIALSGIGGMLFGALLVVVLFFAMLGFKPDPLTAKFARWETIAIFAVFAIFLFFIFGGGQISGVAIDNETTAAFLMIAVVVLAVVFITSDGKKEAA